MNKQDKQSMNRVREKGHSALRVHESISNKQDRKIQ